MASFNFFREFRTNLAKGAFDFTSDSTCTLTVALTTAANAPVNTYDELADLTQIAYTNLSSRVITTVTVSEAGGTVSFNAADLTLTASGGAVATFRYVVLYDDDSTNDKLIGWYDVGSDVTLADGSTFTIDFTTGKFATLS